MNRNGRPQFPCAFISADALGVAATIFSDFGSDHLVERLSGQPNIVANITQVLTGERTFLEVCNSYKLPVDEMDEGDICVLTGVAGVDPHDVFVVANNKVVFKGEEKRAIANLFELRRKTDCSGGPAAVNSCAWPDSRCSVIIPNNTTHTWTHTLMSLQPERGIDHLHEAHNCRPSHAIIRHDNPQEAL